jgi:hemerythrin-like domain-containing protein
MDIRPGCGMMGFAEASGPLCAGLERLRREHPPLLKQMEELADSARGVADDAGSGGWKEALRSLEEKVRSFTAELDLHSRREEDVLFPMMAKYIGRETGPIAVMEYEHEQAKARLSEFLSEVEKFDESAGADAARRIAGEVEAAVQILTDHFMKEENVLFPMAERILSDAEKEELLERIQAI